MFEIKFLLQETPTAGCLCYVCLSHIKVIITDLSTKKQTFVNYPYLDNYNAKTIGEVNLYCYDPTRNLSEFLRIYKKFNNPQAYDQCSHNCADAAYIPLDYFFPEPPKTKCRLQFFSKINISTPAGVFRKAQRLEKQFGIKIHEDYTASLLQEENALLDNRPIKQVMN